MKDINPLYFSDYLLESGMEQCEWCGEVFGVHDLKPAQLDVTSWAFVCSPCLEGYDWKHSA